MSSQIESRLTLLMAEMGRQWDKDTEGEVDRTSHREASDDKRALIGSLGRSLVRTRCWDGRDTSIPAVRGAVQGSEEEKGDLAGVMGILNYGSMVSTSHTQPSHSARCHH